MEHKKDYIKMMRKKLIQEKDKVSILRRTLADQQIAQENLANQLLAARENLANNNDQVVLLRPDSYQCKICIELTTTIMSCSECGFGSCVACDERRTSRLCYFCNTSSLFHKCRLN